MKGQRYCAAKSPSGWYCVLAKGHDGHHMTINNAAMWKGTPGRPLFWPQEPDEGLTREQTDEMKRQTNPTLTQGEIARPTPVAPPRPPPVAPAPMVSNVPQFTGRPCPECGSMNTVPNGKCLLCLEPYCGHSGECG